MLTFVICEDETTFTDYYKKEIDKIMMNLDIEYTYQIFKGYTEKWRHFAISDTTFKIYLLDIKTTAGSGLDAARYIREEIDDWQSMIIMITAYQEYKYDALGKRLMLIDFINKLDNFSRRLNDAINIALKNYDNRPKALKYTYKKVIYNVEFSKIIYIEKELDNKRCIIKTTEGDYFIPYNLATVFKMLDKRFFKICRSIIINTEQISNYNKKTNIITFKNNLELNAVSRDNKKELINRVRGIN